VGVAPPASSIPPRIRRLQARATGGGRQGHDRVARLPPRRFCRLSRGGYRTDSILKKGLRLGTFDPAPLGVMGSTLGRVPYFLRIVEQQDGPWWFRRGRDDVKWFEEFAEAVEYATGIAGEHRPSQVLVHRLDGGAEVVAFESEARVKFFKVIIGLVVVVALGVVVFRRLTGDQSGGTDWAAREPELGATDLSTPALFVR